MTSTYTLTEESIADEEQEEFMCNQESTSRLEFMSYTFKSGKIYQGQSLQGKIHGLGTLSWVDGNQYVGSFHQNMRQGQGKMTWKDGTQF